MIISGDCDFIQLQNYSGVEQFSNLTKKPITEEDPQYALFRMICKGQKKDDVPSVLSDDTQFVDKRRQTPLRETRIKEWWETKHIPDEFKKNFARNSKVLDLYHTPNNLKDLIIESYDEQKDKKTNQKEIYAYLSKNRCRGLLENIEDFF